jgi:hypothetical protein
VTSYHFGHDFNASVTQQVRFTVTAHSVIRSSANNVYYDIAVAKFPPTGTDVGVYTGG